MSWNRDSERKAGKTMAIGSHVFVLIFAIVWCVLAGSTAPFMLLFGIPFAGLAAYRLYMLLRMSKKDGSTKAQDPWEHPQVTHKQNSPGSFCPYCGSSLEDAFVYCPQCGRKVK